MLQSIPLTSILKSTGKSDLVQAGDAVISSSGTINRKQLRLRTLSLNCLTSPLRRFLERVRDATASVSKLLGKETIPAFLTSLLHHLTPNLATRLRPAHRLHRRQAAVESTWLRGPGPRPQPSITHHDLPGAIPVMQSIRTRQPGTDRTACIVFTASKWAHRPDWLFPTQVAFGRAPNKTTWPWVRHCEMTSRTVSRSRSSNDTISRWVRWSARLPMKPVRSVRSVGDTGFGLGFFFDQHRVGSMTRIESTTNSQALPRIYWIGPTGDRCCPNFQRRFVGSAQSTQALNRLDRQTTTRRQVNPARA